MLIAIISLQQLAAQSSVTDSLENILAEQLERGETAAIGETYYQLARQAYVAKDFPKLQVYSAAALQLPLPPARTHFFQSQRYLAFADTVPLSEELHFRLLDTSVQHISLAGNDERTYELKMHSGFAYRVISQYNESIAAFEQLKSEILANAPNDHQEQLLEVYFELASLYAHLNDINKGIEAFRSGVDISVQLPPSYMSAQLYMMGSYLMSGRATIEETHRLELIAEKHARAVGHQSMLVFILSSRAEYFRRQDGMRDSTLFYLSEAKKLHAELKDTSELILVFFQLSKISQEDGMIEEALLHLEMVRDFCADQSGAGYCQSLNLDLAQLFFELPQLDSAKFYAKKALEEAQQRTHPTYKAISNKLLAAISEQEGDFRAALYHERLYREFNDSLSSVNAQEAFAAERALQNTESEKEKREKAELQAQLLTSTNRQYRIAGFALLILLLLGGGLLWQLNRTRLSLAQTNAKLNSLNTTKDKFFGLIAHDLRGPVIALGTVGGQLKSLLVKNKQAEAEETAGEIEVTSQRLSRLLDNLLSWALINKGMVSYRPEHIQLADIVEENIAIFLTTAELKRVALKSNIGADQLIYADPRAVSTVIRNLINNALKFTPPGGVVNLSARVASDGIELSVSDNGIGIPPEKMKTLFELASGSSFGTEGEKGTGLGLVLCREFVKLNKGSIWAESENGQGCSFYVLWPVGP